jgi:hypothetical protein
MKAYSVEEFTKLAKSGGLAKPISEKPHTARTTGAEKPKEAPEAKTGENEAKSARKMGSESASQEAPPPPKESAFLQPLLERPSPLNSGDIAVIPAAAGDPVALVEGCPTSRLG